MSNLLSINVNERVERKNGLTYLSWAWAWAEVLKIDPAAEWEAVDYAQPDGTVAPWICLPGGSVMVKVRVTIKGRSRSCLLPVMDHKNAAIKQPDAFAVNKAHMRALAKAIAMHGLGLYIYAGEDLPPGEPETDDAYNNACDAIDTARDAAELGKRWKAIENYYAEDAKTVAALKARKEGRLALWAQAPTGSA